MSKRNRENRARKQRAARKYRPQSSAVPPIPAGLMENPQARRRLAIMIPFLYLAKRNPYTPGKKLPDGSLIIGTGTNQQGYIERDQVSQLIVEAQHELGVTYDEIIEMLLEGETSGLLQITESEPGALERQGAELLAAKLAIVD